MIPPEKIDPIPHPYGEDLPCADNKPVAPKKQEAKAVTVQPPRPKPWEKTYVLLPSFEKVKGDKVLYAHASRILHHETNPGCARALMQKHGDRYVWINPPAIPLSTEEMDSVFALPYKRVPHPAYGNARIPAYEMIRFFGQHYAWLLWRLLFLFYHRARRAHYSEPFRRFDH